VCGYHSWTYSPDGELIHASAPGEMSFDKACYALKRAHAKVVAGLVFLCLAEEPPEDFAEVADLFAPYVGPHELGKRKGAYQQNIVEEGNWKLVMENNRECYHCEAGHPELTCTFFPTYGYAADEIPARLQPAYQRFLDAEPRLHDNCDRNGVPYALVEDLSGRPTGFRIERAA
ncbi:aromatic ring-hydroxylating oxygenase subunit alpha, partial [Catellatospora coxensis]|uniref:aromatic ring-hydroxylating oxygenase subunit alpha n=1 Tax=Catellatospora coxensis TaxID=310354 RepID=UPI0031CEB524